MADEEWFHYLQPPTPRRHRLRGGFRAVRLNVVGWVALLVPAGLAGILLALLGGLPPLLGAVVGGLVSWATALAVDRRRWSRFEVGISADHELPELQALTRRLQAQGVPVRIEPAFPGETARYRVITTHRWLGPVRDSLYELGGQEA